MFIDRAVPGPFLVLDAAGNKAAILWLAGGFKWNMSNLSARVKNVSQIDMLLNPAAV